jgi:hypothetical protein
MDAIVLQTDKACQLIVAPLHSLIRHPYREVTENYDCLAPPTSPGYRTLVDLPA